MFRVVIMMPFDAKFIWLKLSLQFAVDFSCTPEKSERHWPANSYQWFGKGVNSFYYLVSVFFCFAPCDLQGCLHVKLWREISTALTSLTSAHWIARVLLQVRPSCQLCTAAASRLVEILGGHLWCDCVTLPQFPSSLSSSSCCLFGVSTQYAPRIMSSNQAEWSPGSN